MNPKLIALAFSTLLGACTGAGSHAAARAGTAPVACEGSSVRSDAELARYAGCTEIEGSLSIEGVTTLAPLRDVHRIDGALSVRNTRRLYTLAGLEALDEVGELRIEKNVGLINAGSLAPSSGIRERMRDLLPRLDEALVRFEALAKTAQAAVQ